MAVRVLVVGKDPLARGGLVALLAREPSVAVVGEAAPEDLDALASSSGAEALIVDAAGGAPPLEGAPAAVALVGNEDQAAEALGAGARGVLLRRAEGAQIAAALVAAAQGLLVVDASLGPALARPRASSAPPGEPLTPREQQVLALLSLGLSNKAIAARLAISEHTAKFHVNSILAKLGAGSRAEAVVRAARLGLIAI
jgi:DNA-binding NarL/FixJ family response regulator